MSAEFYDRLVEALINPGELSQDSSDFFRTTPGQDISSSRNRLLRGALLNGDEDQIIQLVKDASNTVGPENAHLWFFEIMEKLATDEMKKVSTTSTKAVTWGPDQSFPD